MSQPTKLFYFLLIGLFLGVTSCEDDALEELPTADERIVWTGATFSFEKMDGANPTDAANQDRLSSTVALTRGNEGGQIYNAISENSFDKDTSPAGTKWALGTIDNIDNLDFKDFRDAIKPEDVVGVDLVLFLVEDNIFLSVRFTSWSKGKEGGFAYERSSR